MAATGFSFLGQNEMQLLIDLQRNTLKGLRDRTNALKLQYPANQPRNDRRLVGPTNLPRFHHHEAIRLSDGRRQHIGHLNKADGRWRILIQ
jgi:hypothetical protein